VILWGVGWGGGVVVWVGRKGIRWEGGGGEVALKKFLKRVRCLTIELFWYMIICRLLRYLPTFRNVVPHTGNGTETWEICCRSIDIISEEVIVSIASVLRISDLAGS